MNSQTRQKSDSNRSSQAGAVQPQESERGATQRPSAAARPIHEVRFGRIRAAIWENETEHGKRHNVTIHRIYKRDDQWQESLSFGRDDLPLAAKALDLCHTWIYENTRSAALQEST